MVTNEQPPVASESVFHPLQPLRGGFRRDAIIACVLTLVLHLALLLGLPENFLAEASRFQQPAAFEILLEEPPQQQAATPPQRFVEANPEVPENPPDQTDHYSFRDQQAADQSDRPVVDGEPDTGGTEDSQKIVESPPPSLEPMQPVAGTIAAAAPASPDERTEPATAEPIEAPAQLPTRARADAYPFDDTASEGEGVRLMPGTEQVESEDTEDGAIPLTQAAAQATTAAPAQTSDAAPRPSPRPRPRLAPDLVEAPLRQSLGSANQRGLVAIDATFSAFGEYQQQLVIAVQRGWYQEIEFYQPLDAAVWVHIRFVLQADGMVRDLRVVETTASELATFLCATAIEKRSPFRPWTREMVEVYGQEQTLNFRFFYR